ncbi:amylo-alpha-1,6-glucosidase [Nakamurella sp. GG22]
MTVSDHMILADGTLFATSAIGNVDREEDAAYGLYVADTRLLSEWTLTVGDRPLGAGAAQVGVSSRRWALMPRAIRNRPDPLFLERDQRVDGDGLAETLTIRNTMASELSTTITVKVGVDFADQFTVRTDGRRYDLSAAQRSHTVVDDGLRFAYRHPRNGRVFEATCAVSASPRPVVTAGNGHHLLGWTVQLPPHAEQTITITVGPAARPVRPRFAATRGRGASTFGVDDLDQSALDRLRARSLEDLDALMIDAPGSPGLRVPAAGAPWFLTLFGRDSLVTSVLAGSARPELAPAVLRALATTQGTRNDPRSLEQPGRIIHEIRVSELATLGMVPYGRYFGSVDATALFLSVLGRTALVDLDKADGARLARELRPAALAAIQWLRGPGGLDEAGFVTYRPDPSGLANQGWKDSEDSTVFADGRIAEGPIALCEVQGYVFDALRRTAALARSVWDDTALADDLDHETTALQVRFLERFWLSDKQFPALALDGAGRPVDSLCSNAGHLLWSGLLPPAEARCVADRLVSRQFSSGWGIRTLAAGQPPYSPLSYHNGSVWPHDSMLTAMGMAECGLGEHALLVAGSVAACGSRLSNRLPEVIGGFSREEFPEPVRYRLAGIPQAWSAAAGVAAVRLLRRGGAEGDDGRARGF